ncbi:hypothetical protein CL658_03575 [bacterium]|nr:hypothetical protein [bacterium]|tara:strand:+ start:928 stop:2184 length:1257 start_codon:yes stop_codon:yes gene_type:complete
MDNESNKSLVVGVTTFLMLVVLGALLIWQSDIFRKVTGYELIGRVDHIGGLIDGSAVRYRGYTIGYVIKILPTPDHIDVRFFLDGSIKVPIDSKVKIMFDGLVGENYIQIEPGLNKDSFYQDGDIVDGKSGSDLANFIDLGSQNLIQSEAILNHLNSFLTDPVLFGQVKSIIRNIYDITSDLSSLTKVELQSLLDTANHSVSSIQSMIDSINDEESLALIQDSIKNFHDTSLALAQFKTLSAALSDPKTVHTLMRIIENLEQVSTDLEGFIGVVGDGSPFGMFNDIKLSTNTHVAYAPTISKGYFDTVFGVDKGRFGLIGGLGNRFGDITFQHFQQSYRFSSLFRSRFGIIYKTEGIGLDFYPRDDLTVSASLYDFNNRYFSLSTAYDLNDYLNLELMYRKDSMLDQGGVDLGVSLDL